MAIILDPLRDRWRSAYGGVVGVLDRSTYNSRNFAKSPRNYSKTQRQNNNKFASMVEEWNTLTSGEKESWQAFGELYTTTDKYGNAIHISGWAWFTKLNQPLAISGISINTSPPDDPDSTYNPSLNVVPFLGGPNLAATASILPSGGEFVRINRLLNRPLSRLNAPGTLLSYLTWTSSTSLPVIVATSDEFITGLSSAWFSLKPYDAHGRSPGETIVSVTV